MDMNSILSKELKKLDRVQILVIMQLCMNELTRKEQELSETTAPCQEKQG